MKRIIGLLFVTPAIGLLLGCAAVEEVPDAAMWGSHTVFYVNGHPVSSDEFSWHYALVVEQMAEGAKLMPEWNDTIAGGPPEDISRQLEAWIKERNTKEYESIEEMMHDVSNSRLPEDLRRKQDAWIKYVSAREEKSTLELFETYGAEVAALGSLIWKIGLYTDALEAGHNVPEESVEAMVLSHLEGDREYYDLNKPDPDDLWLARRHHDSITLFIGRVGEDRYWREIRPLQIERNLISVFYTYPQSGDPTDDPTTEQERVAMNEAAYEDAVVEFTDDWDSDATVEQALEYIRQYVALSHELHAEIPNQPTVSR